MIKRCQVFHYCLLVIQCSSIHSFTSVHFPPILPVFLLPCKSVFMADAVLFSLPSFRHCGLQSCYWKSIMHITLSFSTYSCPVLSWMITYNSHCDGPFSDLTVLHHCGTLSTKDPSSWFCFCCLWVLLSYYISLYLLSMVILFLCLSDLLHLAWYSPSPSIYQQISWPSSFQRAA